MSKKESKYGSDREQIEDLVNECINTHNELILVELIYRLEHEYIDIARLATYDDYKKNWTHQEVVNYITYNT